MDTIGNLLTLIRNAEGASHLELSVPHSKASAALLEILKSSGYIESFKVDDSTPKHLVIKLVAGTNHKYKRLSKPGRRLYTASQDIPMVLRGLGIVIVSTSKGMMTGKDANKHKLGGELICEVS